MNRDKAKGKVNEIAGNLQRKAGRLTGSKKTELKGALRETTGKVQQGAGALKDGAKKVVRRVRAEVERPVRVETRTKTTRTRVTRRTRPM